MFWGVFDVWLVKENSEGEEIRRIEKVNNLFTIIWYKNKKNKCIFFCVFEHRELIFSLRQTSEYDALILTARAKRKGSLCSMDHEIYIWNLMASVGGVIIN